MHADGEIGIGTATRMRATDRQRAYQAARRHSGRVRIAKRALPVIAAAAMLALIGYMWLSRITPDVAIDLTASAIRNGKLVMANPKLDGFTAEDRPYSVRAARAVQDLRGSSRVIDLERIQATVPLSGEISARIEAPNGIFDSEANTLEVTESLTVETTDGKRAELGAASIDFTAGSLKTADPVRISMPGAELRADRMEVENGGKRMLFESHVILVVQPGAFDYAAPGAQPGAGSGG